MSVVAISPSGLGLPMERILPMIPMERVGKAEEVAEAFNGLRTLFRDRPDLVAGDLAILLEPTEGWVEAGCQGTLHIRAEFEPKKGLRGASDLDYTCGHMNIPAGPGWLELEIIEEPYYIFNGRLYKNAKGMESGNPPLWHWSITARCPA